MVFVGDLEDENDVLDWMLEQKRDESIEEIDRETLFDYIVSKDFLAVVFCKYSKWFPNNQHLMNSIWHVFLMGSNATNFKN